jgi:3-dehydroquinate dehydratase-2
MHGPNLDQLDRRPAGVYGELSLSKLEEQISTWARELGLDVRVFQTNFEGAYVEELHRARDYADGLILNPGAWTHYAWAIHDALEIAALPAVEVHISDVMAREEWRRVSVVRDLCFQTISGKGPDGYREALAALQAKLA